jgi:choline dehydrogenase
VGLICLWNRAGNSALGRNPSAHLASDDFQDAAVIDGNYVGTEHDFAAIVHAIEAARELGNQHAFDSLRESELIPGPKASAEEIRELARLASASFGHPVGPFSVRRA